MMIMFLSGPLIECFLSLLRSWLPIWIEISLGELEALQLCIAVVIDRWDGVPLDP